MELALQQNRCWAREIVPGSNDFSFRTLNEREPVSFQMETRWLASTGVNSCAK